MDSVQGSSVPHTALRVPTHPVECLRFIVLPGCSVCGQPTRFFCGGCRECPAFCSPEHFMKVRPGVPSHLDAFDDCPQLWPIHSLTCGRVAAVNGAGSSGRRDAQQATGNPLSGTVTLPTRYAVSAPLTSTNVGLPVPGQTGGPHDCTVMSMYAKHDGGEYGLVCV